MSLKSREAGKLALAGIAAVAAFGSVASSAQAAKLSLNYQCKYPLIGVQPLKIDIDAAIPTSYPKDTLTSPFTIDVTATAGGSTARAMQLIGARSLEGTSAAGATLTLADGFKQKLNVPIAITNWTTTSAQVPPPLVLKATGATPAVTFDTTGKANVTVDSISLNLTARNAAGQAIPLQPVKTDVNGAAAVQSDTDPGTFDVSCKLDPASQATKLADITVTDSATPTSDTSAPSTPGAVSVVTTATSATLTYGASNDNVGVVGYEIKREGLRVATAPGTKVSLPKLAPSSTANYTVAAKDAAGNTSELRSFTVTTPANVVNTASVADYNADLSGTAQLKTLITGNLPLKGGIAAKLTTIDGKIDAALTLNTATGRLSALGFLPVTAKVGFVSVGSTTGSLSDGLLTTNTKLRIKLLDVKLFGALSIAGGNNCQTKSLSNITLTSGANFDPVVGGAIAGTFAISDLNDCGLLTGIVSPLTAGGGNRINATLAPKF